MVNLRFGASLETLGESGGEVGIRIAGGDSAGTFSANGETAMGDPAGGAFLASALMRS
jgi:hypothetical protein